MDLNKEEWTRIRSRIKKVDRDFVSRGNYSNAARKLTEINNQIVALINGNKKIVRVNEKKRDPCPRDLERDYQAQRALQSENLSKALELFYELANSTCLSKEDEIVKNASTYIEKRQEGIKQRFRDWDKKKRAAGELTAELSAIQEEIKIIQRHQPGWAEGLQEEYPLFFNIIEPGIVKIAEVESKDVVESAADEEPAKKVLQAKDIARPADIGVETGPFYPISMDIWQSAWRADFNVEKMEPLFKYLKRNNIKSINLNPGVAMYPEPGFQAELVKKITPLLDGFRNAGVEKINYLYAELNYPVEYYADFLQNRPGMGINILVDDSEFMDMFSTEFENRVENFKHHRVKYSAFITLESKGNSGVSDSLRYWVIENVDYPILMSYFSCSLEDQKQILKKYLERGDEIGKKKAVGIAVLLGTKSVGREASCERKLSGLELLTFIRDLHNWASNYECYGGIVLETNQRFPGVDVNLGQNNL
jgi:hypothetical protein